MLRQAGLPELDEFRVFGTPIESDRGSLDDGRRASRRDSLGAEFTRWAVSLMGVGLLKRRITHGGTAQAILQTLRLIAAFSWALRSVRSWKTAFWKCGACGRGRSDDALGRRSLRSGTRSAHVLLRGKSAGGTLLRYQEERAFAVDSGWAAGNQMMRPSPRSPLPAGGYYLRCD